MDIEFLIYGLALGFIAGIFTAAALITASGSSRLESITRRMKDRIVMDAPDEDESHGRTVEGFCYGKPNGPVFTKEARDVLVKGNEDMKTLLRGYQG